MFDQCSLHAGWSVGLLVRLLLIGFTVLVISHAQSAHENLNADCGLMLASIVPGLHQTMMANPGDAVSRMMLGT